MNVQKRFLNYVNYWTTSSEESTSHPSTARQLEFAKALVEEMNSIGLSNVSLDENGYVYGLLAATPDCENVRAIGFISHMDTAPDASGKDIHPQIIENYDGKDILLPATNDYIRLDDFPHLANYVGNTIITTDGTTLLGADDKAGIAEILTAIENLKNNPTLSHGDIWIGFTPDEEIGAGADLFDLKRFPAEFAYTVDGDDESDIAYENFNAASADFTITGKSVHPGEAKNIMINAASVACEIQNMLPQEQTPEHTCEREGFYHLTDIKGNVAHASLSYIIRDHDFTSYQQKIDNVKAIAAAMNNKYGSGTVTVTVEESYRNMLEIIEKHMDIIELAQNAISKNGLTPVSKPVRGGTDGARLSFDGLPCPNLGTGGFGFHGPYEHIAVESMEKVVSILMDIAVLNAK